MTVWLWMINGEDHGRILSWSLFKIVFGHMHRNSVKMNDTYSQNLSGDCIRGLNIRSNGIHVWRRIKYKWAAYLQIWAFYSGDSAVLWDVAPCRSCVNRRFGGTYHLHIQCRKFCERGPAHAGSSLADFSTLNMEVIRSSETSVHIRSTRRHTPEDDIHQHRYSLWLSNPNVQKKSYSSWSHAKFRVRYDFTESGVECWQNDDWQVKAGLLGDNPHHFQFYRNSCHVECPAIKPGRIAGNLIARRNGAIYKCRQ
jgi:hypothetical protein